MGESHQALPRELPMEPEAFGRALVETGDIDPVYVMLKRAQLPHAQLCRWLISFWCFYHAGAASKMSEAGDTEDYWPTMREAAASPGNNPWPRNPERRHFRGTKAPAAINWLRGQRADELIADATRHDEPILTQECVMTRILSWPAFGPWAAFKACDMLEVLGLAKIRFDPALPLMYEEPRKGLELIAQRRGIPPDHAFAALRMYMSGLTVPWGGRQCGVQEVETVLCKWKSHASGSQKAYWVGHDIAGLRKDLVGWGDTATRLLACCPPNVDRGIRVAALPPVKKPRKPRVWTEEERERQRQQVLAQHAGTYVKKGR